MHVLLVNDDGIQSRGLRILADVFCGAGHKVLVVAPERQCSAFSHHITFMKPLFAQKVEWPGVEACWIDGTPADCVKFGLKGLDTDGIDIVVSGINEGYNMGTDVHYSGTVAAAMEAAFMDKPAIAISAAHDVADCVLEMAAKEALAMAERLHKKPLPSHRVLNINVPNCAPEEVKGRLAVPLAFNAYVDTVEKRMHPRGFPYYWSVFSSEECQPVGENDVTWNGRGYITYTVLGWDLTMHAETEAFLNDEA